MVTNDGLGGNTMLEHPVIQLLVFGDHRKFQIKIHLYLNLKHAYHIDY